MVKHVLTPVHILALFGMLLGVTLTACSPQAEELTPKAQHITEPSKITDQPFDPAIDDWPHSRSDLPPDPRVVYGRLKNGLRYAILPVKDERDSVAIQMLIEGGFKHEPKDAYGVAHLVEHMAFRGARGNDETSVIHDLESMGASFGGDLNGFTQYDNTFYRLNLAEPKSKDVHKALASFSRFATEPNLSEETLEAEKKVVLAERNQRNTLRARSALSLTQFITPDKGRNKIPGIGTPESIKALTLKQASDFYAQHYRPETSLIVITGKVDVKATQNSLKSLFGNWASTAPIAAPRAAPEIPDFSTFPDTYIFSEDGVRTSVVAVQNAPPTHANNTVSFERQRFLDHIANSILRRRVNIRIEDEKSVSWMNIYRRRKDNQNTREVHMGATNYAKAIKIFEEERLRAVTYGFSQSDIDYAIQNRKAIIETSQGDPGTIKAWSEARLIRNQFAKGFVYKNHAQALSLLESFAGEANAQDYQQAAINMWGDFKPRYWTQNKNAKTKTLKVIKSAQNKVDASTLKPPENEAASIYKAPVFKTQGKITSRDTLKGKDITMLAYDNGVRLHYSKRTDNADNIEISLALKGVASQHSKYYAAIIERVAVLSRADIKGASKADLDRAYLGQKANFKAFVQGDYLHLSASTRPKDLRAALDVLTAFIQDPDFSSSYHSKELGQSIKTAKIRSEASPSAAAALVLNSQYSKKSPIFASKTASRSISNSKTISQLETLLESAPIEVGIVGDFDSKILETEFANTLGAMPRKTAPKNTALRKPVNMLDPGISYIGYRSDDTQMALLYCWAETDGSLSDRDTVTGTSLQVLRNRLNARVREELGATYSVNRMHYINPAIPEFKYTCLSTQLAPESETDVNAAFMDIIANAQSEPVTQAELTRVIEPALSQIERYKNANSFTAFTISTAHSAPDDLDKVDRRVRLLKDLKPNVVFENTKRRFKLTDMHMFRVANGNWGAENSLQTAAFKAKLGAALDQHNYAVSLGLSSKASERKNAIEWYKKAATQGHKPSHMALGKYYAHQTKDLPLAAKHLEAAQDAYEGAFLLADIYFKNPDMFPSITDDRIMELFEQSAEAGFVYGQRGLAQRYKDGTITPRDEVTALKWALISVNNFQAETNSNFIKRFEDGLTNLQIQSAQKTADDWKIAFYLRPTDTVKD